MAEDKHGSPKGGAEGADGEAGSGSFLVGVLKEVDPREKRVAGTPASVERLLKMGLRVIVESGAGAGAGFEDAAYAEAGARVVPTAADVWGEADIVVKVRAPMEVPDSEEHEVDRVREGQRLISFLWPAQNKELVERLRARKATVLAMDAVPRITRAQKLDALSAMSNVAGYRAVVEAAYCYGRLLGGQVTAAGKVKPAQVFIVGAGVAGLAAIGAARSLGAQVKAFDTRPVVREQIESMGAQFVPFEFQGETGEGKGGYAKEVSDAYLAAEQQLIAEHCRGSDIVITTALIPGRKAPELITSGAVVGMRRGSVIVDLAAEQGGNCALTERDKTVERYGVLINGHTDLLSRMALQASELYANTVATLIEEILGKARVWQLNMQDEIQRGMLVVHDGELLWPPPSPTIRPGAPAPQKPSAPGGAHGAKPEAPSSPWPARIGMVAALLVLVPVGLFGQRELVQHMTVFLLACVVGWHVVWNVTPALHTPLMSVTNAISGIILIGGMLLSASGSVGVPVAAILGAVAVLLASINVAGGFLVTQRMLRMFQR
ncbi:Re/Si-specific NAD(P)(+) transhydrogenase subunit alpha [Chondromyces apiculatus]|uniref:proton-translocating NAD(P)(+) transhydrogenase n=1 Tax=Chondromyces apiculatus DSM 436 TaxID=1192034 RepID=A0A017T159_9BACT|nr:Re/Si-specific NAD(P)(+) transhydrogenase subunit alpha [Chondromyces apiculatus]EYF02540.1 NAD(P) transhydrogenase alpha subunit [Chondromyces apiculatus DSM 436]